MKKQVKVFIIPIDTKFEQYRISIPVLRFPNKNTTFLKGR